MKRLTKMHKDGFGICNFDNQYGDQKCEKMTVNCYYCDRMLQMLTKLAIYEESEEQQR